MCHLFWPETNFCSFPKFLICLKQVVAKASSSCLASRSNGFISDSILPYLCQPASLLPQGSFSESHTKPCDLSDDYQAPPMFPLWVIALSTLALPFSGLWLPRCTHSRLGCCSSSVPHCLPGFYWMSTGLLTLRGSKPEYPNQLPQQLSPQGFLLTWSSKLGTWGRGTAIRAPGPQTPPKAPCNIHSSISRASGWTIFCLLHRNVLCRMGSVSLVTPPNSFFLLLPKGST